MSAHIAVQVASLTVPQTSQAALTDVTRSRDLTGKITPEPFMSAVATTTLSSKGQVVIPESIRNALGLAPGAQFAVLAEGDVVVLKVIAPLSIKDFGALIAKARRTAAKSGLTPRDVRRAITKVRRGR